MIVCMCLACFFFSQQINNSSVCRYSLVSTFDAQVKKKQKKKQKWGTLDFILSIYFYSFCFFFLKYIFVDNDWIAWQFHRFSYFYKQWCGQWLIWKHLICQLWLWYFSRLILVYFFFLFFIILSFSLFLILGRDKTKKKETKWLNNSA